MPRKPIAVTAMSPAERRRKSDEEKRHRGEVRITAWISADAAAALMVLTEGRTERGAIKTAIEQALVRASVRVKV